MEEPTDLAERSEVMDCALRLVRGTQRLDGDAVKEALAWLEAQPSDRVSMLYVALATILRENTMFPLPMIWETYFRPGMSESVRWAAAALKAIVDEDEEAVAALFTGDLPADEQNRRQLRMISLVAANTGGGIGA